MPDMEQIELNGIVYDVRDPTKAPDGYGLGMSGTSATDLNKELNCGFFAWGSGCANAPFSYGMGIALNRFNGRYTQLLFNPHMSGSGEIVVRHYDGSKWLPAEWVNPPMVPGVEYRTTERHNGKVVYARVIDFGALPNNSEKSVLASPANAEVFSISGYARGNSYNIPIPGYQAIKSLGSTRSTGYLWLSTNADMSSYYGYITIKYTKD